MPTAVAIGTYVATYFLVAWGFLVFPLDSAAAPSLATSWVVQGLAAAVVTAALICGIMVGKRNGLGKVHFAPHSLMMSAIGTGMLWMGWFGFNAGSALEATGAAGLAFFNTLFGTAVAGVAWAGTEWLIKGKPSLLGAASGVVAGLVAITPAAGFAGPMGAIVLGLVVSPICLFFVSVVKNMLGYDDSLDAFGVHGVGGGNIGGGGRLRGDGRRQLYAG